MSISRRTDTIWIRNRRSLTASTPAPRPAIPSSTINTCSSTRATRLIRYFDNIAPGRNGGGWVDTYGTRYLDRYAEQLWDTMLAKTPQIMLFQYSDLLRAAQIGDRSAWSSLDTTFKMSELNKWSANGGATGPANYAAVAGYSLSEVNAVLGKLG